MVYSICKISSHGVFTISCKHKGYLSKTYVYSFVENTIHLCIDRNIQPNVTAGISNYNVNN